MTKLEIHIECIRDYIEDGRVEESFDFIIEHLAEVERKLQELGYGFPCEKHNNVEWIAQVKRDKEGFHCFGCFMDSRAKT